MLKSPSFYSCDAIIKVVNGVVDSKKGTLSNKNLFHKYMWIEYHCQVEHSPE